MVIDTFSLLKVPTICIVSLIKSYILRLIMNLCPLSLLDFKMKQDSLFGKNHQTFLKVCKIGRCFL